MNVKTQDYFREMVTEKPAYVVHNRFGILMYFCVNF